MTSKTLSYRKAAFRRPYVWVSPDSQVTQVWACFLQDGRELNIELSPEEASKLVFGMQQALIGLSPVAYASTNPSVAPVPQNAGLNSENRPDSRVKASVALESRPREGYGSQYADDSPEINVNRPQKQLIVQTKPTAGRSVWTDEDETIVGYNCKNNHQKTPKTTTGRFPKSPEENLSKPAIERKRMPKSRVQAFLDSASEENVASIKPRKGKVKNALSTAIQGEIVL